MAIYIAHAAADRSTARSLASFLKGQSLPVRTTKAEVMTPLTKQAESVIMVWSRDMARTLKSSGASFQKLLADARTILVDVDGQNVPEMAASALKVVNARAPGLRQSRSWRAVSALAKGQAEASEEVAIVPVADPAAVIGVQTGDAFAPLTTKQRTQFLSAYAALLILSLSLVGGVAYFFPQIIGVLG